MSYVYIKKIVNQIVSIVFFGITDYFLPSPNWLLGGEKYNYWEF